MVHNSRQTESLPDQSPFSSLQILKLSPFKKYRLLHMMVATWTREELLKLVISILPKLTDSGAQVYPSITKIDEH